LAVGGENNTVTLWNVVTHKPVATVRGHRSGVKDVAFSVDGQLVASASGDSTVKLWKVARYIPDQQYVEEDWYTSVAFAPKGNVLASALGKYPTPLQQSSGEIQLWDVPGAEKRTLVSDETHWLSVTLSPDERTLAAGGVRYDGDERSGVFALWNVVSGKQLCRFYDEGEAVWSVAFSPDGEKVATGAAPKGVRLRNATTGELVAVLDASFSAMSVAFSPPDGRYLAAGGGKWGNGVSRLWDTRTGRELGALGGHKNLVSSVAFAPDGRILAAGDSLGNIKLWDIATRRELHILLGQAGIVTSVAFSPNGKTLASGRVDRTVKLWHVDTGDELTTLDAGLTVWSLAFSPDGKTLAAGCGDGGVTLWHATTERQN
jgi:WD40 repeat protein